MKHAIAIATAPVKALLSGALASALCATGAFACSSEHSEEVGSTKQADSYCTGGGESCISCDVVCTWHWDLGNSPGETGPFCIQLLDECTASAECHNSVDCPGGGS